jgi:hypothetical protein
VTGGRQFLHPDEPLESLIAPVKVTPDRWGALPRAYIRLIDDMALPVATQDLMIAEAHRFVPDAPFTVHSLPGGHSPFATRPAELAELPAATSDAKINRWQLQPSAPASHRLSALLAAIHCLYVALCT